MSLLLLLGNASPTELADALGTAARLPGRLLKAMLDAIMKEDDRIGGRAVTRLTAQLDSSETATASVLSTIGFGEYTDGLRDARFLVGGEVISATGRNSNTPFLFDNLTRGLEGTEVRTHPPGTLVYDMAQNTSAVDLVRRGFLVDYAVGEDLEVLARNLGLERCPGTSQEALRRIIKAVAYLPKQTFDAFDKALEALLGGINYRVYERTASDPYTVFVDIEPDPSDDIRGRFFLNGGELQDTTAGLTVSTNYAINHVIGVYDDTPLTRMGIRDGFTNYFAGGGSFAGSTITLGSSPGAAGTPVIVDYGAFIAHYLAADETVRQDALQGDHWAYLADPLLAARCLLDQIRAAGVQVELRTRL